MARNAPNHGILRLNKGAERGSLPRYANGYAYTFRDRRGTGTLTRHIQDFAIAPSPSTLAREIWPDKQTLRDRIAELRAEGLSFRRISAVVDLHWTRVAQILKGK
jgi:hypothetical protein